MPLVYVHGVGNRLGDTYDRRCVERDALFRQFMFPAINANQDDVVHNPYWGAFGARLRWDGASLPAGDLESLGAPHPRDAPDWLLAEVATSTPVEHPDRLLRAVADHDVAAAVDLIFSLLTQESAADAPTIGDAASRFVGYLRYREGLYPESDQGQRYPWLASVTDDSTFLEQLWQQSAGWALDRNGRPAQVDQDTAAQVEVLGGGQVPEWLRAVPRRVRRSLARMARIPVSAMVTNSRAAFGGTLALLAGDALTYLRERGEIGAPGPIARVVVEAIEAASVRRADGAPLVVVAHSLGGVIAYDALTHFRPDLTVDVLLTVGSQVGLFAELALLGRAETEGTPARIAIPSGIRTWINVVDRADPLAFLAEPVFDRVSDYRYQTPTVWAHTAYLRQPTFHARLADRVRAALA